MSSRNSGHVSVRLEHPQDYEAVRRVVTAAFTESKHGHNGEADLVDQLRTNCEELLS